MANLRCLTEDVVNTSLSAAAVMAPGMASVNDRMGGAEGVSSDNGPWEGDRHAPRTDERLARALACSNRTAPVEPAGLERGRAMELLYVVELTIEGDDAFNRVVSHVAEWLSSPEAPLDSSDLQSNGAQNLADAVAPDGRHPRYGDWEILEIGDDRALRMVVSQAVGTDLELSTRVTVAKIDKVVRFRVGIGRSAARRWPVPVGSTEVFQPRIFRILDQDDSLSLHAEGQIVSGRYIPVKTAQEAHAVAEALWSEDRLPLALIHVRSPKSWALAREISRKLLGLVRTVTVNFETARVIADRCPEVKVPFGGMAIAWPGLSAGALTLSASSLSGLEVEEIRQFLAQRVGALAALGNGEDRAWRRMRSLVEDAQMEELSERVSRARVGGDLAGEIVALSQKIEALEAAKAELEDIGEEALQQADHSKTIARQLVSERNNAREEAEMWKKSYAELSAGKVVSTPEPQDPWSEIQDLVPGEDPESTFLAITDAASERIVFTERARKSWSGIEYPEPWDMKEKLILLARAAVSLYDGTEKSIPMLDDWMKEEFGLNVALTDQTISKWKKKDMRWLNEFTFEGEVLNATPHVKVRDAVKFNECGRIHFALEGAEKRGRLVVQHVGVKTYK